MRVSKINFNGFEKGIVEYKNQIILNDTLSDNLTAVKHANGRDWWLILQKYILGGESNEYLTFLITPEGIQGPFSQKVGKWWNDLTFTGQASFSTDGSKFAVMNPNNGLYLYDFDRCSGKLSNANHITFPGDTILSSGVAFSENNRFLYVSTTLNVYQFDMESSNIASSKTVVARYDGFISGGLSSYFFQAMRGPNGKIYISAPNSVQHLHVIHNPNGKGADCDLRQHGLRLKSYIGWCTPNFPNYRLGALPDSPCDSLSGVDEGPGIDTEEFVLYPNPSDGQISFKNLNQLNFDDYLIRVFTVSGVKIFESTLQKSLDFSQQPNGMYIYKIIDKKGRLMQAGKFAINS
ncbi:MAG: T9SS type A sorting domain-containing protein [Saprospiraceae bacterium]